MLSRSLVLPAGITARISSDLDLSFGEKERRIMQAYVPGVKEDGAGTEYANISIHHKQSSVPSLSGDAFNLTLSDKWGNDVSQDLYHLLYSACRLKLMQLGMFCAHAASVGDDQSQVLIVGPSGSGKSTVALSLVEKHNWKIYSGNKTVIKFSEQNQMEVVAGTHTMTIESDNAAIQDPAIDSNGIKYGRRIAFELNNQQYSTVSNLPVRAVVLVNLANRKHDDKQLSVGEGVHRLYPVFMDAVNADTTVAGGAGIFCEAPPLGTQQSLLGNLRATLQTTPVYRLNGPLNYVVKRISAL